MLPLVLFMTLVGGVLGFRFRVFILAPVITVACLVLALGGTHLVAPTWPTVFAIVAVGSAIQIGYLAGLLARRAVAAARLSNARLEPTAVKSRA